MINDEFPGFPDNVATPPHVFHHYDDTRPKYTKEQEVRNIALRLAIDVASHVPHVNSTKAVIDIAEEFATYMTVGRTP